MSSLAACLTSSSSTIPLTRCSTCRLATLSHSTSGGRWECALQRKIQRLCLRFDLLRHNRNCFTVSLPPKCPRCPRRSGANTSWSNTKCGRHLMPSPLEISACYLYSGTPRRNVVEPVKQARSVLPLTSHMWWLSICPIPCALVNLSWGCLALSGKRQNPRVMSLCFLWKRLPKKLVSFQGARDLIFTRKLICLVIKYSNVNTFVRFLLWILWNICKLLNCLNFPHSCKNGFSMEADAVNRKWNFTSLATHA